MRIKAILFVTWLSIAGLVPSASAGPPPTALGSRVADFRLRSVEGRDVALYDFRGKQAAVLVFLGTDCPLGDLYLPRLEAIAREYDEKGVVVLGIDSNAGATAEGVARHAKEFGATFPILLDPDRAIADRLGADRTCVAVVVDGRGMLRYRGAIDDQYAYTSRKPDPTRSYLADALDQILAGKPVEVATTEVQGCPIQRAEASSSKPEPTREVTYSRDVAPILQARCQSCHRAGQIGPFALASYRDAKRWSASIAEVIDDGRMPPWHADPRSGHFANDRSLAPADKATLLAWLDGSMPEGDPADLPVPARFPDDWGIGEPDAVFAMSKPADVKAEGVMKYQWHRIPTHFAEDKWVKALEVRPGDRRVVHHILIFVAQGDDGPMPDEVRGNQLAGYVPGDEPTVFPDGMGKRIPAGADLLFQVHYTPIGKATTDQSAIALVFADGPQSHEVHTRGIATRALRIPPGEANYQAPKASMTFPVDATLLSMWPHMHVRGKDFRFTAVYPDGREEVLLSVPRYDFNWQTCYTLEEPKALPAGSRIECVAHFDNSAGNPNNPDPSAEVRFGPQTTDEMMIGYIDFILDDTGQVKSSGGREQARALLGPGTAVDQAAEAFERYDEDGDGQIRADEMKNPRIFERFDLNKDGVVTRGETELVFQFLTRIQGARPGGGRPN